MYNVTYCNNMCIIDVFDIVYVFYCFFFSKGLLKDSEVMTYLETNFTLSVDTSKRKVVEVVA